MAWAFIKIAILAVLVILSLGVIPDRRRGAIIAVSSCISSRPRDIAQNDR
jgi:hypothetical protein